MKTVLNQSLLKSLIITDFLLETSKKSSKYNLRYQNLKISIPFKNNGLIYSDPFETIKDLKQISRMMQFLTYSSKNNSRVLNFFFSSDNNFIDFELLIPTILKFSKLFSLNLNPHLEKSNSTCSKIQIGILLNDLQNYEKNIIKNRINKKCFLHLKLNSEVNSAFSEYFIKNSMSDFKKVLFFFTFLNQVLIVSNTNKSFH